MQGWRAAMHCGKADIAELARAAHMSCSRSPAAADERASRWLRGVSGRIDQINSILRLRIVIGSSGRRGLKFEVVGQDVANAIVLAAPAWS